MKNTILKSIVLTLFFVAGLQMVKAQVTGLSNYEIFIDPGHSQTENMGLYNYSEAEKVLRVALELKAMFEQQTDIKAVHMSRLTDDDYISLSGRTDLANSLGADFYYSIHSDAGSPSANSTLTMYGGFNNNGVTLEKVPNGGKAFGEALCADLTGVMRTTTRGNYADRIFYEGNVATHANQWPYLHVNRTTNMASLLSEAGFHTNPAQQQRNFNAEWKKMEALSAFRSFLEYKGIDRPSIGIIAGVITDADTGEPVNGITITAGGKTYTTDSYASLFNKYSNDPDELKNGFYYLEGFTNGQELGLIVEAADYPAVNQQVIVSTNPNGRTAENINFVDVQVTSSVPAKVTQVNVSEGVLADVMPGKDILVTFSRKMDRNTVEQAITIEPQAPLAFTWKDDFVLAINTNQLSFETTYSVSIDGTVAKNALTQQLIDGDADGLPGGNYTFQLTTSSNDVTAPVITELWPANSEIIEESRPVIRVVFDEKIDAATVTPDALLVTNVTSSQQVAGIVELHEVNGQGVIHFFPTEDLLNDQDYTLTITAGISDLYGNAINVNESTFTVNEQKLSVVTVIDSFDEGITSWWQPQSSGSTSGIITEVTNRVHENSVVVKSINSTGSMKFNYGWLNPGSGYIRQYIPSSAPQNTNRFDTKHVLQMYVFGDGSTHKFRFMIRDGSSKLECSDWYTINWIGWRLVSWDLTSGVSNGWVNGDGVLDGTGFYLDGIHMTSSVGGNQTGSFYFDDLRFVERLPYVPTHVGDEKISDLKVYPNPVQDQLNISSDDVIQTVEVIGLDGRKYIQRKVGADTYKLNVSDLAGGYYVLTVTTEAGIQVKKIRVKN